MASYHSLPTEIKNLIHTVLTTSRLINKEILTIKNAEFITRMNYISLERCSDYLHTAEHMVCTSNMDFGCNLYNKGKYIISASNFGDDYELVSKEDMVCSIDNMLYRKSSGTFIIRDDVDLDLLSTYHILMGRNMQRTIAKDTVLKMLHSKISLRYAASNKAVYHSWLYFNAMILGIRPVNIEVRTMYVTNYVKECAQLHVDIVNYFKNL
jgi:hypothetical protein